MITVHLPYHGFLTGLAEGTPDDGKSWFLNRISSLPSPDLVCGVESKLTRTATYVVHTRIVGKPRPFG